MKKLTDKQHRIILQALETEGNSLCTEDRLNYGKELEEVITILNKAVSIEVKQEWEV